MWKRIKTLTSFFIRTSFTSNKKKKSTWILYVIVILYLGGVSIYLSKEMLDVLIALRQSDSFVTMILLASFSMPLMEGIISCFNLLYFSKDNLALLPMPISQKEYFFCKTMAVILFSYFVLLFLGLIPLFLFGIRLHMNFWFYPCSILVLLILPILPSVLAIVINTGVLSLLTRIRSKSVIQAITSTVSILLTLAISLSVSYFTSDTRTDMLVLNHTALFSQADKLLPFLHWGEDVILDQNLLPLLYLIVCNAAAVFVLIQCFTKTYFRILLKVSFLNEGVSSRKLDRKKAFHSRGIFASYFHKEIVSYIRKPTYLTQLLLPSVVVPFIMSASFYFGFSSSESLDWSTVYPAFLDSELQKYLLLPAVLMFMLFCSMYAFLSIVAISKDGEDAVLMKMFPIPFYHQLIIKALPDTIMVNIIHLFVGTLLTALFRVPLRLTALSFLALIPYSFAHGGIILMDAAHPKLHWNNEMQLVKNNFRTLLPVGTGILNVILVAALSFVAELSGYLTALILFVFYLMLSVLLYFFIKKKDLNLAKNIV